jgi:hypothetical protein
MFFSLAEDIAPILLDICSTVITLVLQNVCLSASLLHLLQVPCYSPTSRINVP